MNARTSDPTFLPLPAGWTPIDPPPVDPARGSPGVVRLRVSGLDGTPAWLYTVTGDVGSAARRRLRTEQPKLDQTLRAVATEPAGAVLLPWLEYGDPKAARPYLVCARPGTTFADDLGRSPLPADRVVAIAVTCIDALYVLHRYGRAHGLIAPQSLHHDGERVRLSSPLPPALAELVAVAGGTGHEPPEVLRGGEPNAAADVFALASTAWTLLSGRPPFGAADDQLARLTAAEPPPLQRQDVPAAMESALRAALSPDPARRPDLPTLAQALRIVEDGAVPVSDVAPAPAHPPAVTPAGGSDPTERQDTLAPTRPVREQGRPLGSRYLLDALIGRGATGHVWRGHIRGSDDGQVVAVKLLRSELAEDPEVVTRFMRERSSLMRLAHPNLVAVRDLVAEGGALAIVMDFVEGRDLRSALAGGPLPVADAARLLSETAAALAAVHAADIVHRDLKPENIIVEPHNGTTRARLTDFGLARAVESSALTRATQLVGTPAYVAPEVVAGRAPGPAVDVYALGVTAYEMLAGRRPFVVESTAALLRAQLDEEPQRPGGMPDQLWTLVSACLRKEPQYRPGATELAQAWARVADGLDPGPLAVPAAPIQQAAPPAPPVPDELRTQSGRQLTTTAQRPLGARHATPEPEHRSRVKWWWALAAVLIIGFGGGFGYVALTKKDDAPKTPAELAPYPLVARVVETKLGPTVNWIVPPGTSTPDSYFVVLPQDHKTPPGGPLPSSSRKYLAPALDPGACVVVLMYHAAKGPPKGAPPAAACRPKTAAKPTAKAPSTTATRSPTK